MRAYSYKLWKGKKRGVVGETHKIYPIGGAESVSIPEVSIFKQKYGQKVRYVTMPVITRRISDDGVKIVLERMLDARKLSARQIEIVKGHVGFP